jgi:hypothetical protein
LLLLLMSCWFAGVMPLGGGSAHRVVEVHTHHSSIAFDLSKVGCAIHLATGRRKQYQQLWVWRSCSRL